GFGNRATGKFHNEGIGGKRRIDIVGSRLNGISDGTNGEIRNDADNLRTHAVRHFGTTVHNFRSSPAPVLTDRGLRRFEAQGSYGRFIEENCRILGNLVASM